MPLSPKRAAVAAALLAAACGGGPGAPDGGSSAPPLARASHVVVVVLENHGFDTVIGSGAMPFLNDLARRSGVASSYYANTHPSIGNYFMMTTGRLVTNDDKFDGVVTDDNVVRRLNAAGKTWKVYAEGLPRAGYLGGDTGSYVKRHNPFAYLTDVVSDPAQAAHLVPFPELTADVAADALPDYAALVPDRTHDAHDCPPSTSHCTDFDRLAAADAWLAATIGPLLGSAAFGSSGLLLITFDEAAPSDTANGGGRIATIVVSGRTPAGAVSGRFYQHESLLATTMGALGLPAPGAGATAPPMSDLFPQ